MLEVYDDFTGGVQVPAGANYIGGWTTDATHDVTVRAATGEGHGGVLTAGAWFDCDDAQLIISQEYMSFEDLRFVGTAGNNTPCLGLSQDNIHLTKSPILTR